MLGNDERAVSVPAGRRRLPVTVLSGFLGTGKTTLLTRILNAKYGQRLAVLVNDMAAVNIDVELVRMGGAEDDSLFEMHNGCICCTLREDFLAQLVEIAETGRFDYVVIESTGVSEPMPVAEAFTFDLPDGRPVRDYVFVDTLVTVVDATNFLERYREAEELPAAETGTEDKTVADLLVQQVEFANLIVLSKADLVSESRLGELTAVIKALNPTARTIAAVHGNVPMHAVLNTGRFSLAKAHRMPGWLSVMRGEVRSEAGEYGIESFVWRARRPLSPERFELFLNAAWNYGEILRIKGFVWIAGQEIIGLWHQAGGMMRLQDAGRWWAYTDKRDWPVRGESLDWIKKKWDDDVGDCRQEVVFIGQGLRKDALVAALENCLLTHREFAQTRTGWTKIRHYFAGLMEIV